MHPSSPQIAPDVLAAVRDAVLEREKLIDYRELARRMEVSVATARGLVAARIVKPAIHRGNVVRFHWPTVVEQLRRN